MTVQCIMYIFDSIAEMVLECLLQMAQLYSCNLMTYKVVSFICELADCLAARLFHWTFWHSVSSTDCDCNTSFGQNVAPIGMLSEEEIMNVYFELQPTVSQKSDRKNYYQSHKQKVRQSETAEQTS